MTVKAAVHRREKHYSELGSLQGEQHPGKIKYVGEPIRQTMSLYGEEIVSGEQTFLRWMQEIKLLSPRD